MNAEQTPMNGNWQVCYWHPVLFTDEMRFTPSNVSDMEKSETLWQMFRCLQHNLRRWQDNSNRQVSSCLLRRIPTELHRSGLWAQRTSGPQSTLMKSICVWSETCVIAHGRSPCTLHKKMDIGPAAGLMPFYRPDLHCTPKLCTLGCTILEELDYFCNLNGLQVLCHATNSDKKNKAKLWRKKKKKKSHKRVKEKAMAWGHNRLNHSRFGNSCLSTAPVATFIFTKAGKVGLHCFILLNWTHWFPWHINNFVLYWWLLGVTLIFW